MPKAAILLMGILVVFALIVPFQSSAFNVEKSTSNSYENSSGFIFWGSTIYATSITEGGTCGCVNFTAVSLSPSQNPAHTFSMNVTGGNTTFTQDNAANIVLQNAGPTNNTFWFPTGVSEIDVNSTQILPSQFLTSYSAWKASAIPSVYSSGSYFTVSASNAQVVVWFALVDVTLILSHQNLGAAVLSPDYFLVSYQKGGSPQTFDAEDGTNVFTTDVSSPITIAGVSGNPISSQRFCLSECQTVNTGATAGQTAVTFTFGYWTQDNVTAKSSGLPYPDSFLTSINQQPQITFQSGGATAKAYLYSSYNTYWMDNSSSWTVPNPSFIDLHFFAASPATATVTSATLQTISYSTSTLYGGCSSGNAFTLLLNGCLFPLFVDSFTAQLGSFGMGFLLMIINVTLYTKNENPLTITLLMVLEGAIFGLILPQFFLPLASIFVVIGLMGSIYQLVRNR